MSDSDEEYAARLQALAAKTEDKKEKAELLAAAHEAAGHVLTGDGHRRPAA